MLHQSANPVGPFSPPAISAASAAHRSAAVVAAGEDYDRWLTERFRGAANIAWRPVGSEEAQNLMALAPLVLPPGLPSSKLHFAMRVYDDMGGLIRRTLCLIDPATWRLLCRHAQCGIRTFDDEIDWNARTADWRRVYDFNTPARIAVCEAA